MKKQIWVIIALVIGVSSFLLLKKTASLTRVTEVPLANEPTHQLTTDMDAPSAPETSVGTQTPTPQSTPPQAKISTPKAAGPKTEKTEPYQSTGYDEILNSYRNTGKIFQFSDCRIPYQKSKLTLKTGSKFAIQNVSNDTHMFNVLGKSYSLGQAGYIVITASTTGTYEVTCTGGGKAELTVVQ